MACELAQSSVSSHVQLYVVGFSTAVPPAAESVVDEQVHEPTAGETNTDFQKKTKPLSFGSTAAIIGLILISAFGRRPDGLH